MTKQSIKYWVTLGLTSPALALQSLAEGETTTAVPQAVQTAVTELGTAAEDYAAQVYPFVKKVGLAFLGVALLYVLFRVIRSFMKGR